MTGSVSCRLIEVPHGQRPMVQDILARHGITVVLDAYPPGSVLSGNGDAARLASALAQDAPGAASWVWGTPPGTGGGQAVLWAFTPELGLYTAPCDSSGTPCPDLDAVWRAFGDAEPGTWTTPMESAMGARANATGYAWANRLNDPRLEWPEEQAGRVLLCDVCEQGVTGEPAKHAAGCAQDDDHAGLCLRRWWSPRAACQWCGSIGRLHEASLAEARRVLPTLTGRPGRLMLASPHTAEGPFNTGRDAWEIWQSGIYAYPEGPGRTHAALRAAPYTAVRRDPGDGTGPVYQVKAVVPGTCSVSHLVRMRPDGTPGTVTSKGNPVGGVQARKARAAVAKTRDREDSARLMAVLRDDVRAGGPGTAYQAQWLNGSGVRNDSASEFLITRTGDPGWERRAVISPAALQEAFPGIAIIDATGHDAAARALAFCDYLDREGITQGEPPRKFRRRDRVTESVPGHVACTVVDAWTAPDPAGNWVEWVMFARDADKPYPAGCFRSDLLVHLPPGPARPRVPGRSAARRSGFAPGGDLPPARGRGAAK